MTVTGTPTFAFTLGEAERQAAYASGSDTAELVFAYEVQAGEIDTDGISWSANALTLDGGTVRLTTTDPDVEEDAALAHPAQPMLAGHRVDADPPGVESASMRETVLELLYDEALDAELGACRDCLHPDGGFGAEPSGVGRSLRQHGDADLRVGAGRGRDGDAGLHGAGVEPGEGRGGQPRAGVHRPGGDSGAGGGSTSTSPHRRR